MINEIVRFLTPHAGNPLEAFFFTVIVFGLLLSLATSQRYGRPETWERNWRGGARVNALDTDQGSVGELSHAVASGWERLASNMPGLLLIVGLLGTFLGLGLALDKASSILQGSDDSMKAMSGSLAELTGMMKDLGAKFKTSTWGIVAFITIKLWEAAPWSAESKRTDWCLGRMKAEIDQSRLETLSRHKERDHANLAAMEHVATRVVEALNAQGLLFSAEIKQLLATEQKNGKQADLHFSALTTRLDEQHQQLSVIATHSESLPTISQMSAPLSHLPSIDDSLKRMEALETRMGELANTTKNTDKSVQNYIGTKTDSLQRQEAAVQSMGESATLLSESASLLKGGVQIMQQELGSAIQALNADFAGHLSEMKASMDHNVARLGTVMESIENNLGGTIETMSREFTQNTQDMAANLKGATDNISSAVHDLSGHVGTVVKEVQVTTESAKDMQKKTSTQFTLTSETLNSAIEVMSSNMDQLGKSISQGLKEASEAGQKMDAVAKKLVSFPQLVQEFNAFNDHSRIMADLHAETQTSLKTLNDSLEPIGASIELLEELSASARELSPIAKDVRALAEIGTIKASRHASEIQLGQPRLA
ncbi:hypothetical protein [Achromobacter sp.]|uniref:hypothetical protein n=1 Tax=Achromobacter sp. TaxID=134375 RepID=UPI0031DF45E6